MRTTNMTLSPSKVRDALAAMDYSFDSRPCVYFIQSLHSKNCYVGSSSQVMGRLRVHFSELLRGAHHCEPLQRSFDKYGVDHFVWGVCEFVDDISVLLDREQHWIDILGEYNTCKVAGSPRGVKMNLSEDERARRVAVGKALSASLSAEQIAYALDRALAAKAGRPLSDDHKRKLSDASKGRQLAPDHRARLSEINKNRVYSKAELVSRGESIKKALRAKTNDEKAAWKANLSISLTGKPSSKRGVPMSEESKVKMSIAGKGKVISEAQKEKLRAAMLSKSPEWYKARGEQIRLAKARKKAGL